MKKEYVEFFSIMTVLVVLSLLFSYIDADRTIGRLVVLPEGKWPGINIFPWSFFYDYAAVPGFIIAGLGFLILILSFFKEKFTLLQKHGLFLILLLLLGPGLVVNVILKDNLGRARPREIKEFGGTYEYTEIWQKGKSGKNSSFPSGHASIAFYVLGPWFLFRKSQKNVALLFLGSGISYGALIGVTRILQGGHYLSDVLWAGGFVYLVGLILSKIMHVDEPCRLS